MQTYRHPKEWFVKMIGKAIRRTDSLNCHCVECTPGADPAVTITGKAHAEFLYDTLQCGHGHRYEAVEKDE